MGRKESTCKQSTSTVAVTTSASRSRKSEKRRSSRRVDGLPSEGPLSMANACEKRVTHAQPESSAVTTLRCVVGR